MDRALELANAIAANAQVAVRQSKAAIRRGLQTDMTTGAAFESEAFGLCFSTQDQKKRHECLCEQGKVHRFPEPLREGGDPLRILPSCYPIWWACSCLIAVGFLAVRLKVMPAEASKPLSSMLMKITLPATVFASLIRPFDAEFIKLGLIAIGLSLLFFSLFSACLCPCPGSSGCPTAAGGCGAAAPPTPTPALWAFQLSTPSLGTRG